MTLQPILFYYIYGTEIKKTYQPGSLWYRYLVIDRPPPPPTVSIRFYVDQRSLCTVQSYFNNVSPECNLLFTWGDFTWGQSSHINIHLIIVFSDAISVGRQLSA